MGLFSKLFSVPQLAMKSADTAAPVPVTAIPETDWWPSETDWHYSANGTLCRDYAVRVVTDFISRQIASLPFKVYRKDADGGAHEVHDSALSRLIRNPSRLPGVSRYRFFRSLLRDMLLEDKWVCTVGLDRATGEYTLRRIPPDGYTLTANGFGEITKMTVSATTGNRGREYALPSPLVVLDVGYVDGLDLGDPVLATLQPLLAEAQHREPWRPVARLRVQAERHAMGFAGRLRQLRARLAQLFARRRTRRRTHHADGRHGDPPG